MEKLIPLENRSFSSVYITNFLYRKNNIFLMDNHRMAAWCWAHCLIPDCKYTVIHIDKHNDTLGNNIDAWITPFSNGFKHLTFREYDSIKYHHSEFDSYKVFRWDNYIPIFHHFYSNSISKYFFYTHNSGVISDNVKDHITQMSIFDLLYDFPNYFEDYTERLIINIDIDYFFIGSPISKRFLSDSAIKQIVKSIMKFASDPKNIVTIALSPECCGGWEKAEQFFKKFFGEYDLKI